MNPGDLATRPQLTAHVFLAALGATAYLDLGDLQGHQYENKRESSPLVVAQKGYLRTIGSLTSQIDPMWEFTLKEAFGKVNELFHAGTKNTDVSQSAVSAPSGTASFSAVAQGSTYFLGKYDVATVVVTVSASTKTEGTDYTVDYGSGAITIVVGGGIADAANVSVTFGCTLQVFEDYTPWNKSPMQRFAAQIHEYDQHGGANGIPFRYHTIAQAQCWIEGPETHDAKKPADRKLKIIPVTLPTVRYRKTSNPA